LDKQEKFERKKKSQQSTPQTIKLHLNYKSCDFKYPLSCLSHHKNPCLTSFWYEKRKGNFALPS